MCLNVQLRFVFANSLSSHAEHPEPEYQAAAEDVQRPAGEETKWVYMLSQQSALLTEHKQQTIYYLIVS